MSAAHKIGVVQPDRCARAQFFWQDEKSDAREDLLERRNPEPQQE